MLNRYQVVKIGTIGFNVENINTLLKDYNSDDRVKEATIFGFDQHYDHIIHNHNISTTMYIMLELN